MRIGIHGLCFGGTHAQNITCKAPANLSASAIFYASNIPPKESLAGIKAPLLVVYGDHDQVLKIERVKDLEQTLKRLKKNFQFEIYPGAGHAFFIEGAPNYNENASKDSWEKLLAFFEKYLPLPRT